MSRLLSPALLALAVLSGPGVSAAFAGAPLKCIDYRCRSAIEQRASGPVIHHDCTRKHGQVICADFPYSRKLNGAPLKGVGR